MKSGYYAGIDIGTNGARLVIKDALMNNKEKSILLKYKR